MHTDKLMPTETLPERKIDFELPLAVKIRKTMVEAMAEYQMLSEGDRVMVCCSGGKDSSILLALLSEVQRRAPYKFSVEAVMLDQGHPGFDANAFSKWVRGDLGLGLTILSKDTYSIVKEKITDGVYCSLCSRLRRGILYDHAYTQGFTKMALGHHRDDLSETLLMNLFYTGKLASMPPKLKSDDGRNILIRPLSFVAEKDLRELAKQWNFPIIPCNLCGSQDGMKRQRIKKLISDLETEIPFLGNSMLKAMSNVRSSQLMDRELWDFQNLKSDPKSDGSELNF
jgi:tRNA 2-thiocytidine biosynthesis protein TtcA